MKPKPDRLALVVIFVLSLALYWSTAYLSITWWDSSEYSAAAACLGITAAPGSIILTICGWILSTLVWHNPALVFNLFAGAITALTVVVSTMIVRRVRSLSPDGHANESRGAERLLIVAASGVIICSAALWEYARMLTPYSLSALFTGFIVAAVLRWWERADQPDSWKNLFIITLLLGLDFSVHRSNAVLVPGIAVVMFIRNPRMFLSLRSYIVALAGMCAGLSVQLLYIPMSLADPALNLGEPNSIGRLWDFVSLKQYGGNFLLDIVTRKGPLWSYQIPHYVRCFAESFFHPSQSTFILGYAPALLGVAGLLHLFVAERRLAVALVLLLIISIAASIIYFNIPENYFRSLHRHYLPTFVIFSVFVFLGVPAVLKAVARLERRRRVLAHVGLAALLLGTFYAQYSDNRYLLDASRNTFTVDHATNITESVDENGILFSSGDNDFFPEQYFQIAERKRPDILHCNLSLLNLDWYVKQIQRHDRTFPLGGYSIDEDRVTPGKWVTESVSIPIEPEVANRYCSETDTVRLSLPGLRGKNWNLPQDVVLFDLIKANRWRRPVYFSKQSLGPELYAWLRPYLSDEGLVWKLVPDSSNPQNVPAMEKALGRFLLRGYDDRTLALDDVSRGISGIYYGVFLDVVTDRIKRGDRAGASALLDRMTSALPTERLRPGDELLSAIQEARGRVDTMVFRK